MSFDAFDSLQEIIDGESAHELEPLKPIGEECAHENLEGQGTCKQCGLQMRGLVTKSNWVQNYNKYSRKSTEEKTIFGDVQGLGISEEVCFEANRLYQKVAPDRIHRGGSRKGIICACVFYSTNNLVGQHMSLEQVIRIFHLDRRIALRGIQIVNDLNLPETCYTTNAESYIRAFLEELGALPESTAEVLALYRRVEGEEFLDRPRPQSIAVAFIYYWIQQKKIPTIKIDELSRVTCVSKLTIEKIAREIDSAIKLQNARNNGP